MNIKLIQIASAAFVLSVGAYSFSDSTPDISPMDIKASTEYGQRNILEVTALEDDLQINNIVVNRGNCVVKLGAFNQRPKHFPITLQYGQSLIARTSMRGCNLREVTAETNKGNWTWTW